MVSQSHILQLDKAIDQLLKVESSVPDADFEHLGTGVTQQNASGATGYMTISYGPGHVFNSSGKLFQAQTINFGGKDPMNS